MRTKQAEVSAEIASLRAALAGIEERVLLWRRESAVLRVESESADACLSRSESGSAGSFYRARKFAQVCLVLAEHRLSRLRGFENERQCVMGKFEQQVEIWKTPQ